MICVHTRSVFLLFLEDGPRNTTILRNNKVILQVTLEERKIMTLHCSSNCNPRCKMNWYKDGKQLSEKKNEMFRMPLNRSMSGFYRCEATGEEGNELSKLVEVTVTCKLQCFQCIKIF